MMHGHLPDPDYDAPFDGPRMEAAGPPHPAAASMRPVGVLAEAGKATTAPASSVPTPSPYDAHLF